MDMDELNAQRQRELAQFLRQARARSNPEAAGIKTGSRRRTTGLRREEVATLAGVSAIWYTWLEQGRDIQPSQKLLGSLATALQLNPSEREYLHALGRTITPQPTEPAHPQPELRRLLAQLPVPAFITDHRWQIIGYNSAASELFSLDDIDRDQLHIMKMLFESSFSREFAPDWEDLARAAVALFHMNYARNIDDPEMSRLVTQLHAESSEFAEMWDEQRIDADPRCVRAIKHWRAGVMRFEFVILRTSGTREITLFSLVPADDRSAEAWERLRNSSPARKESESGDVLCGS